MFDVAQPSTSLEAPPHAVIATTEGLFQDSQLKLVYHLPPSGGLYITYHLSREPETAIDVIILVMTIPSCVWGRSKLYLFGS